MHLNRTPVFRRRVCPCRRIDRIAVIGDMTAVSDVVRVQRKAPPRGRLLRRRICNQSQFSHWRHEHGFHKGFTVAKQANRLRLAFSLDCYRCLPTTAKNNKSGDCAFEYNRRFFSDQFASHQNAHNRRHHQTARPSAGISQTVQSFHARVEVLIHFHTVAVKFQFR